MRHLAPRRILHILTLISIIAACSILSACDDIQPEEIPAEDPTKQSDKSILDRYSLHHIQTYDKKGVNLLSMPYRLLDPRQLNFAPRAETYPLLIFLHGKGKEQGTDGQSHMKHGFRYFYTQQAKYPCFIVYPQCPTDYYWSYSQRPYPMDSHMKGNGPDPVYYAILRLIDHLCANYPIDPDRIIISGFSMGAFGALDIAARSPHIFAGTASIAGGINIDRLPDILYSSLWLEHCLDDKNIPAALTLSLAETLKQYPNTDYTLKIYPQGGHTGFHLFQSDEFMQWVCTRRLTK